MSAFGSTDSRISQAYDNFDDNFVRTRVTANGNAAQSAVHVHTSSRTCACVLNRRRLQLPCKCSIARLVSCRGRTTRLPVRVRRARGRARAARSGRGTCGGGALTFATFVFCKALTHFARKLCTLHEPRQHEPRPHTAPACFTIQHSRQTELGGARGTSDRSPPACRTLAAYLASCRSCGLSGGLTSQSSHQGAWRQTSVKATASSYQSCTASSSVKLAAPVLYYPLYPLGRVKRW